MTAARQQRKSLQGFILALVIGVFGPIFLAGATLAAQSDPVVTDEHSGLAISGFDPVAYFVDGKPRIGRSDLELHLDGVVWRFLNEGNRAAFADHPEVYMPRFGGYDAVAIARGASVPGHPLFWAISGERLYLFYDAKARAAFLAGTAVILERATRNWSKVARTVAR